MESASSVRTGCRISEARTLPARLSSRTCQATRPSASIRIVDCGRSVELSVSGSGLTDFDYKIISLHRPVSRTSSAVNHFQYRSNGYGQRFCGYANSRIANSRTKPIVISRTGQLVDAASIPVVVCFYEHFETPRANVYENANRQAYSKTSAYKKRSLQNV